MKKIMDKLASCIETIGGIAILMMTLIVLLQIVMRYFFNSPLTWSEEIARYIFIYVTFLGAGILVYERGHLFVEVLFNKIQGKAKNVLQLILDLIVLIFSLYLLWSSRYSMQYAHGSRSTAVQIPMEYIGLSVMIGAVLMILFSLYHVINDIKKLTGKEKEL